MDAKIILGGVVVALLLARSRKPALKNGLAPGDYGPGLYYDKSGQRFIVADQALDYGAVLLTDSVVPGVDGNPPFGTVSWPDGKQQDYLMAGSSPRDWKPVGVMR